MDDRVFWYIISRGICEVIFIVGFEFIGFSFCEGGIDIFGVTQGISGFFVESTASDRAMEDLKHRISNDSLGPDSPSGVGNGKAVIGSGIVACGYDREIERFGDICEI